MSGLTPDRLPASFADFDDEQLPEEVTVEVAGFHEDRLPDELPAAFASFDEDRPPGSSAVETSSRCAPQSSTAPCEALGSSLLLEGLPGEARSLVNDFGETLGARVTHVIPRGAPDPVFPRSAAHDWDAWRRQRNDRVFARAREARSRKSFHEQLREAAEEKARERRLQKDWLDRQRRIARGWARWMRWLGEAPVDAENFRREQEDAQGSWLLALAARRPPLAGRAKKKQ